MAKLRNGIVDMVNESKNETYNLPKHQLDYINSGKNPYFNDYRLTNVKIADLIESNPNILDNNYLFSKRNNWGVQPHKYKIDSNKESQQKEFEPIRATYRDGKYIVEDGMHRLRALANNLYSDINIPVKYENEDVDIYNKNAKVSPQIQAIGNNILNTSWRYNKKNDQKTRESMESKTMADWLDDYRTTFNKDEMNQLIAFLHQKTGIPENSMDFTLKPREFRKRRKK